MGNPFVEVSMDLLNLNSKAVIPEKVVKDLKNIYSLWKIKYYQFMEERFKSNSKSIGDTISRNNLAMFSKPGTETRQQGGWLNWKMTGLCFQGCTLQVKLEKAMLMNSSGTRTSLLHRHWQLVVKCTKVTSIYIEWFSQFVNFWVWLHVIFSSSPVCLFVLLFIMSHHHRML